MVSADVGVPKPTRRLVQLIGEVCLSLGSGCLVHTCLHLTGRLDDNANSSFLETLPRLTRIGCVSAWSRWVECFETVDFDSVIDARDLVSPRAGLVRQRLCFAFQLETTDYYRLVAVLMAVPTFWTQNDHDHLGADNLELQLLIAVALVQTPVLACGLPEWKPSEH